MRGPNGLPASGLSPEQMEDWMRKYLLVAFALSSVGCAGQKFAYPGEKLWERFPLEGQRLWEYTNEDSSVEFTLSIEKVGSVLVDGKDIVTLAHTAVDSEGGEVLLHEVDWSTDSDDGIELWSWTDFSTDPAGVTTTFDPPIQMAAREMNAGDSVTTATGGGVFTGQYLGLTDCPNNWSNDTWECAQVELSSDVGGLPFTGVYYIAMSYGMSWMEPSEVGGKWVLANAVFGVDE
jgi:hypothetical protein